MFVYLHRKEEIAPQIFKFSFVPNKSVQYSAGQFAQFTISHLSDSRGTSRWFSLTSSPSEAFISITTRIGKDASSFKKALFNLSLREPITMEAPMGDFVLPRQTNIPLIFIAGGIGISPVRGIATFVHDSKRKATMKVLYAVKEGSPHFYLSELEQAHARVTRRYGTIKPDTAIKFYQDSLVDTQHKPRLYLSGPEPMVDSIRKALIEYGLNSSQIVTDALSGYEYL